MMKKAVFFDMDGTVVDSTTYGTPAVLEATRILHERGILPPPPSKDAVVRAVGANPKDYVRLLYPQIQMSDEIVELVRREIFDRERKMLESGKGKTFPGVERSLKVLREKGYLLVLISNCSRPYFDLVRRRFGLDRFFPVRLCSEDFGFRPKKDVVRWTVEVLGVGRGVMVGDSRFDHEAAVENGLCFVAALYGFGFPHGAPPGSVPAYTGEEVWRAVEECFRRES